jgi:hypothetical protein
VALELRALSILGTFLSPGRCVAAQGPLLAGVDPESLDVVASSS